MSADPNCGVAHGDAAERPPDRVLVAVFASPVAAALTRYAADLGYRIALVEPDAGRQVDMPTDVVARGFAELDGELAAGTADVVVTDHHRDELGELLRDALAAPTRWIGLMSCSATPWPRRPAGSASWATRGTRARTSPR
jgi:xanthine dehydrogenase accessory factor